MYATIQLSVDYLVKCLVNKDHLHVARGYGLIELSYLYRKNCHSFIPQRKIRPIKGIFNEFLQSLINKREFFAHGEKAQVVDRWRSQVFALLYKKTYLWWIRRNWVISFNLIEEWNNQQPQQERYSAGLSEHSCFFSCSLCFMSLASRNSITTAYGTPRQTISTRKSSLFVPLIAIGEFFLFDKLSKV